MGSREVEQRIPSKRQRVILHAALASFEELGYDASTIEDIRRRSAASIGSIYHHFGGKAGIAAALYEQGLSDYQQGLLARMARARTARTLVEGIVLHHLGWAEANPDWARYLLHMRRLDAVAAIEIPLRRRNAAFLREALTLFEPHVQRGEIRRLPAEILLSAVLGPAQEFLRLWLSGRAELTLARARRLLADAAWRAVRSDRRIE
jgi:AcrR family transcriptional regulator